MTPHRLSAPLLILLGLLAACAPAPSSSTTPSGQASAPGPASPSQPAAYPLTLTDDAGREISLAAEPQAIVSLAPSNTEIVCALDACDRIVGVTDFDDYPPEVVDVEKVVTMAQVDVEAVVAAEPDLVLAAGNELTPTAVIDQLAGLGLPVLVLYPESLDEVTADVELVGAAIGQEDEATALVDAMQARVAAVEDAVAGLDEP
jgi:iron complex transport system substrate-binding protein